MEEDTRCCGSGTCIINAEGRCWDGERMCHEPLEASAAGRSSR